MAENTNNLYQILIVSGEASTRELLQRLFQGPQRSIELRDTPRAAMESLQHNPADVVVMDPSGQEELTARLAEQVRRCCPRARIISCTGYWQDDYAGQPRVRRANLMPRETSNVGETLQLADTR